MCRVMAVSFHSTNGRAGHELDALFTLLLPINEIGKRTSHSVEHASCFVLSSLECALDPSLNIANHSRSLSVIVIVLDVLHGRAGKHSFASLHGAARRA